MVWGPSVLESILYTINEMRYSHSTVFLSTISKVYLSKPIFKLHMMKVENDHFNHMAFLLPVTAFCIVFSQRLSKAVRSYGVVGFE